ncbi:MAG: hypothetical protein JW807_17950 [Spirochaetes bacterium]|nr:hypothetical protein [Spirochaetota bacterium]
MNATGTILASIPLFRHCLDEEIGFLHGIGKVAEVKQGHQFDLRKLNTLNVVINGIFEIESMGKTDVVYLSPGSFFGSIPFTENRQTGRINALVDSTLLMFSAEDMYRFFLMSYKCLRGYLKIVDRLGFEVSDIGREYFGGSARIVTVYSPFGQSGKSLLSSLLGESLKKEGKTVILDLSYSGNSVFNCFQKKVTAPLSHRMEDGPSFEKIINERRERVDENLDLVNIAFGSKVKVNPDILSPLLFILSKEYRYIVMDCGDDDVLLRDRVIGLSDYLFAMVKSKKETRRLFEIFDAAVREGQRVYYIVNEYFAGEVTDFSGGMALRKFERPESSEEYNWIRGIADGDALSPLVSLATSKRSALVLESNLLNSLPYAGFLAALSDAGRRFDLMYTSAYGYIVLCLHILSRDWNEFRKRLDQFFSGDRLNKLLDITFPEDHVFKHHLVSKLADELCGANRLETYHDLPLVMAGQNGASGRRLFSTGYLRDMMAASFCLYPLFEEVEVMGERYNSGFPDFRVRVEDLFRVHADELVYVSVNNAAGLAYRDSAPIGFFDRYLNSVQERSRGDRISNLSDSTLVLDVSEKDVRLDRLINNSREISEKLLKNIGR